MSEPNDDINWQQIGAALREPFEPRDVDFRVQGRANEQTGRAQVVAYIDARAVQDRLDAVVGPGNWSFDWQPVVTDKGEVMVAKGILTIHGLSKSDAGSASNFEQSLGAVSHCFKRAAVLWGIGRYLYSLPMAWVSVEKGGRIAEPVLAELRRKLPRPSSQAQSAQHAPEPVLQPEGAPTEAPAPAPAPVNELRTKPATANDQHLLAERLRAVGITSKREAGMFVAEQIGREVNITALANGTSDLTMGECSTLLLRLNEREGVPMANRAS